MAGSYASSILNFFEETPVFGLHSHQQCATGFPGGVVKTLHFHHRRHTFDPW